MQRIFQSAALLLLTALVGAPLAQAARSCRMPGAAHCSNCPMPQPPLDSDNQAKANSSCCRISAARPFPNLTPQPSTAYVLTPPVLDIGAALTPSLVLLSSAANSSGPPVFSPQALLCTFLI